MHKKANLNCPYYFREFYVSWFNLKNVLTYDTTRDTGLSGSELHR